MKKTFIILLLICQMAVHLIFTPMLWGDVIMRLMVVNPSDTEERTVPVRYELPPDIGKNDIVDAAGLNVDYDVAKSAFYVYGDVKMIPKETKQFKIVLKDIWTIPEDEIIEVRTMIDDKRASFEEKESEETAQLVAENLTTRLEEIIARQEEVADNITERMRNHEANLKNFQKLKSEAFAFDSIVKHGSQEAELEDTVNLVIEAENVLDEQVVFPLKYYLPQELKPEDLLDIGFFEVQQDPKTNKLFLYQEATFAPQEVKRFIIKTRNVWEIPEELINRYVAEAEQLTTSLAETDVANIAQLLMQAIDQNAQMITESQGQEGAVKEKIAAFRLNQKRLTVIKDNIDRLRSLKIQVEEKEKKVGGVKNILRQVDILQKLRALSDALFKEKVKKGFVWKIIMTIVVFVIVLTVFFYAIWFLNLKKEQSRKMKVIK